MDETVYKLGDWVEHNYNHKLFKIIKLVRINGTGYVKVILIKLAKGEVLECATIRNYRIDKFHKRFKPSRAAQILYKGK